jgi:DNA-binding response OmpR family regulator
MAEDRKPARVALIEDNPGDVLLIREALREEGLDVDLMHFHDGDEAWASLNRQAEAPQLILLDLNLPRVDGSLLLRQIRAHPVLSQVPIAILTSSQSPADEEEVLSMGAERFIRKPSGLEEFLTSVGGAVRDLLGGGDGSQGG